MFRALPVLAAVAIVALLLILGTRQPTPSTPRPPERNAPSDGPPADPGHPAAVKGETGSVIRGSVRRAGTGTPAVLELYSMFPGESESRAPASLSSEVRLTRVCSPATHVRTQATAGDGTFRLEGLSPGEYRLVATAKDGASGFARIDLPVQGAVGQAEVSIPSGRHTLRGRLLTASGEPYVALVWVVPGPRPMTVMKQLSGTAPVWTGKDGTFAIPGLDDATINVSVLKPGWFFTTFLGVGVPRKEELAEFSAKDWKPADMQVRLREGLPLRGRVLLIGDRTLPELKVWCKPRGGSSRSVKPREDGRFSFSNLPPGTVELGVSLDRIGMVAWDRRIEVQAGRTDVVYEVDLGLPLFVEIENWPSGQREYMRFTRLIPSSGMPENPSLVPSARLGKKIRFEGLPANDTFTLRIIGMDDGTCFVRSGIRASTEPVRVRLAPGRAIRGRLLIPSGHGRATVYARSLFDSVSGKVSSDGSFEIAGLPEGRWLVVARAYGPGDIWSRGEVSVHSGEEITISLEIRSD